VAYTGPKGKNNPAPKVLKSGAYFQFKYF